MIFCHPLVQDFCFLCLHVFDSGVDSLYEFSVIWREYDHSRRIFRIFTCHDHVTYELERMGDHAASVAKQVIKLAPEPPLAEYVKLPDMAELGAQLVHGVLRALVDVDAVAAREAAVMDDDIDRLYHATFDEVVELMRQDPANVERGTRIVIASHYLERIGDRSTNIAEDIVYLVTGDVEDLNP